MRNLSTRLGGIVTAALCAAALGQASAAHAAASEWVGDARAQARLVTAVDAVAGTSLQAGIEFHFPRGWHGYWRTPGDAGVAPHPDWSHAPDVASATIQWPAPTRLVIDGLQNAVYRDDVVLPLTIQLRKAGAPAHLNLTLDYAACSNVCVPEHADLMLALPAATAPPPASAEAAELDAARRAVPALAAQAGISVISSEISTHAGVRSLDLHLRSSTQPFTAPDLFVEGAGSGLPAAPVVRLSNDRHDAQLDVSLPDSTGNARSAQPMALTLVDGARAVDIGSVSANGRSSSALSILPLLSILLTAFAGGLILNLMPCVLPVLSLKAFALLKTAGVSRRSTSRLAAASVFGTLAAFALLALALSALKLGGVAIGWGIQFQQPWFLASMAVVTALFAASLFDWLAIGLPRALADLAGTATTRGPLAEAFLSGAFSTLLATPCSAPLVGTAIGFALGRGPVEIFAVLLAMGLGMSSPFIAIAIAPSLVAWLPRPGAWMNRVRTLLGLLLLATTGWLLVLLASATGVRIALAVALVIAALLGMRALLSGAVKAPASRWTTPLLAGLAIGAIVVAALPENGSAPAAASRDAASASASGDGWQAFDPAGIATLVANGKTVFVDVDATWCLTCKVNALTVLSRPEIRRALAAPNLVRMRADWSHADPGIARYVEGFGRAGIPLDVVYGPGAPNGRALPELLNTSAILDALDHARM